MVLALGLWVLDINDKVMYIYDQIEMSQLEMSDLELKEIQESKSRKQ